MISLSHEDGTFAFTTIYLGSFGLSGVSGSYVSTTNVPITSGTLISSDYGTYGMTVANGQSTNPGVTLSRFGVLRTYINVLIAEPPTTPSSSAIGSNYEYFYYYTQN